MGKCTAKRRGWVAQVVRSMITHEEQIEIVVPDCEPFFRELRVANSFKTPDGKLVALKPGAQIDIVMECENCDGEERKIGFWSRK